MSTISLLLSLLLLFLLSMPFPQSLNESMPSSWLSTMPEEPELLSEGNTSASGLGAFPKPVFLSVPYALPLNGSVPGSYPEPLSRRFNSASGQGIFPNQEPIFFSAPLADPSQANNSVPQTNLRMKPVFYTSVLRTIEFDPAPPRVPPIPMGILINSEGQKVRKRCQCVEGTEKDPDGSTRYVPLKEVISLSGNLYACDCRYLKKIVKKN